MNFSFEGHSQNPGGVTGHMAFDAAGPGVSPTSVYVLSSRRADVPANQTSSFVGPSSSKNSFTVSDTGVVSAARFYSNTNVQVLMLSFDTSNDFQQANNGPAIYNSRGFAGITFTPVADHQGAVPEPATWAMMLAGFGMVGGAARYWRRNVKVSLA